MSEHIYITKWALSEGVIVVPRTLATIDMDGRRLFWPNTGTYNTRSIWGRDGWHETREAAEADLEIRKAKRRKSLEKAIKKLDKPVPFKDFAA